MKPYVLPIPKKYELKTGTFDLTNGAVSVADDLDVRVVKAAVKLKDVLSQKTASYHLFTRGNGNITIAKNAELSSEEYTLEITENAIRIVGGDDAGCFYGIGTLLQILETTEGTAVPALVINDKPDMKHRGFYHDATRGRIPTVDGVKRLVDRLAKLKKNSLQLYVEHTFDFEQFKSTTTKDNILTAEELLEIDQYCYDNFIDFIPSIATFGHLFELLSKPEFSHLCELENHKPEYHFWRERMPHHTINPSDPESFEVVCSLIDQYLPLFRSQYFNICCDETFDLCKGRNAGKDEAQLYISFVSKIIKHVKAAGKTVMMWADIALDHPELLPQIPDDTVLLNWWYEANPDPKRIEKVAQQNKTQVVCPGTVSWYRLMEKPSQSQPNIENMIKYGYQNGAWGLLNTNWGDYGHPAHVECALLGTALGACLSWNVSTVQNTDYDNAVSRLVYGVKENILPLIRELGDLQGSASWYTMFYWCHGRDVAVFKEDNETITKNIERANEIIEILSAIDDAAGTLKPIIVAAKGIVLFNKAALLIKSGEGTTDEWRQEINAWFEEYKVCWLKDSKYSELDVIKEFINKF